MGLQGWPEQPLRGMRPLHVSSHSRAISGHGEDHGQTATRQRRPILTAAAQSAGEGHPPPGHAGRWRRQSSSSRALTRHLPFMFRPLQPPTIFPITSHPLVIPGKPPWPPAAPDALQPPMMPHSRWPTALSSGADCQAPATRPAPAHLSLSLSRARPDLSSSKAPRPVSTAPPLPAAPPPKTPPAVLPRTPRPLRACLDLSTSTLWMCRGLSSAMACLWSHAWVKSGLMVSCKSRAGLGMDRR